MHEIAPLVTSTVVIFVGILVGILFNQRAIDKLESRMESRMDRIESRLDRMQTDMVEFFKMLSSRRGYRYSQEALQSIDCS